MAKKSKKPSGVSISRSKFSFKVGWNRGEDYSDKQDLDYAVILNKKNDSLYNKAAKNAKKDKSTKGLKWKNVSGVTKNTKSKTISLEKYYKDGNDINGFLVRIAGKSKKESLSDYEYKAFDIDPAPKPSLSITWDSNYQNRGTVNIGVPDDEKYKNNPVIKVHYAYVVVNNFDGNKQNKNYWKSNVTKDTTTKSKSFPVDVEGNANKTLLVKAYTEGMGGDSETVYESHSFTEPYKVTNLALNGPNAVNVDKAANTTRISVKWTAIVKKDNKQKPIDQTTLEYYVGIPEISETYTLTHSASDFSKDVELYTLEDGEYKYVEEPDMNVLVRGAGYYKHKVDLYNVPNGAQFTVGANQKDTSGGDCGVVIIPQVVGLDQCIWVRVVTKHDNYPTASNPLLAYTGELTVPTINSVTLSGSGEQTYKAIVTATNNSQVNGSFIALIYRDKNGSGNSGKIIGIIPSGYSTSQPIQCPNWTGNEPISFGAYAVYGRANHKDSKKTPVSGFYVKTTDVAIDPKKTYYTYDSSTGTYTPVDYPTAGSLSTYYENVYFDEYAFYEAMRSDITYKGGSVPVSPTGVTLKTKIDDSSIPEDTVQATWDVPWLEATGAEVTWADHEDAWYSTNGPSSHEVNHIEQPKLNISGLESGKKWYVRIRLYKDNADNTRIYSLHSRTYSIDLSMAPDIPELSISPSGTITENTEIVASWTYITNDGTPQNYAKVEEIVETSEEYPNGRKLLQESTTQQYMSFTPKSLEWETGSEHRLILTVKSASGQYSKESDPVIINIAVPMDLKMTGTSLIKEKNESGVETHTGTPTSPVSFTNEDDSPAEITKLPVTITPHQDGTPWQDSVLEKTPYLYRKVPTNAHSINSEFDTLVGATVAWNQLAYVSDSLDQTKYNVRATGVNGSLVLNGTASISDWTSGFVGWNALRISPLSGHKYYVTGLKSSSDDAYITIGGTTNGIHQFSGTDTFRTYVKQGVVYNNYTISINLFDLTQMFGSTIADYIYSLEQANAGAGVAWIKENYPVLLDYHAYDAGSLISTKTSAHVMRDADDNIIATYTLPNTELRGLFKLDNGKLYADGDVQRSDGNVTRKYGVVDLGTLTYTYSSSFNNFTASISGMASPATSADRNNGIISSKYPASTVITINANQDDKSMLRNNGTVVIRDTSYTDKDIFKTAMSGVYLVYELATPTTETGTGFTNPQIVDPDGTEEYIDERAVAVPVGHETRYADIYDITGTDEVNVHVRGINQWDEEWELGAYFIENGNKLNANNRIRNVNPIYVVPNTRYYINVPYDISSPIDVFYFDSEDNYLGYKTARTARDFVTPNNCAYINFCTWGIYGGTYNHDICINYPSTDHNYHAYQGADYTTDLDQTVYSGTLDAVSGVLTVDKAYIASYNGETITTPWISSYDAYAEGATPTTGAQVVYPLANPITYNLTPQEVEAVVGTNYVWSDEGNYTVRTAAYSEDVLALKELPLTISATGAGSSGTTLVTIKRAEDYHITRPDNDDYNGYVDDVVFEKGVRGDAVDANSITVTLDDLRRRVTQFDDGSKYKIIVTATDDSTGNGQSAVTDDIPDPVVENKTYKYFVVDWDHQAISPSEFPDGTKSSVIIENNTIAKITIGTPDLSYISEHPLDHIDIYRLSADQPVLIYSNALFGETYVDPYPTIGIRGGYRLVYVTDNGDYIDEDNIPAWIDIPAGIDSKFPLIDFGNMEAEYIFNVDSDYSWEKPFTLTHYLGGSIVGDYMTGVEGSGSIKGNVIDDLYPEEYELIRDLARRNVLCHVRKVDGTNIVANVAVSDSNSYKDPAHLHSISFNITAVDNPGQDAMTLSEWEGAE